MYAVWQHNTTLTSVKLKRFVQEPGKSHFSEVEKTRFQGFPA